MEPAEIAAKLFVAKSDHYGDRYIEHLLEQYKVYIASAEKNSDRRQKANEFFLTLNTGLVTILGFMMARVDGNTVPLMMPFVGTVGIAMCYFWYRMVRSYKGLNSGKFTVIHAIEQRLPLALYDTEWEVVGRGEDKGRYWPFSHIELLVPWIFVLIYTFLILASIPWDQIAKLICS